ncbi:MAG: hypothetical protein HY682_10435 [Chloroflexi bacterium]|nr:hypothetical protein [Chloroflexota bacterium]
MTYAYVDDGKVTPLPRIVDVDEYLDYITNRTWPDLTTEVRKALEGLWSSSATPGSGSVAQNFCAACGDLNFAAATPDEIAKRIFAISVKDFQDPYTFDIKKLMKCCVEIATPDGRLIPFCAYNNVGYREQVRDMMQRERARERVLRLTGRIQAPSKK